MRREDAARVRQFAPTVFAEMSERSARAGAVNLGQGFPDFPGPDFVKAAAIAAIRADHNQYAPPSGVPRLREVIASGWSTRYGMNVDPGTDVTVTSGATEAIFDAILALLDPGDELIIFEPFYDSYPASATMAGARPVAIPLVAPDWRFDADRLTAVITPRTRVILLNSPHNPTGKVFTGDELAVVADLAIRHDLIVITDEVYDRILFNGIRHVPIATLPGMWERTLTINSTGKTFSLTGWKIGYAIGPAWLNAALRSVHQFVTFATSTPFQEAMADAFELAIGNGYYEALTAGYDDRRQRLAAHLARAGLAPLPIGGSYFLMSPFDDLPFPDDVAFCRWLIEEVGVTPIPPSAFYLDPSTAPKMVRFCFAKQTATIDEAGRRLARLPLLVARGNGIPGRVR